MGPDLFIWILTGKCNLSCPHCYAKRFRGEEEMGIDEALRLVESLGRAGVGHVGLTGGEVFLYPGWDRLVEALKREGLSTSIVTNGFPLMDEGVLKRIEGVFIFLSLDGASPETHEFLRGFGTWDIVMKAMENLKKREISFATITAINSRNYREAPEIVRMVKGRGGAGACFIPVMGYELSPSPEEMVYMIREVDRVAEEEKFRVSFWCTPFARYLIRSKFSHAGSCRVSEDMDISPSGNILLCDVLDEVLGNIRGRDVIEAWREAENHPLMRALSNPELGEPCRSCPISKICRGGCFARAKLKGDIFSPDPLCPRVSGYKESSPSSPSSPPPSHPHNL